MEILLSSVAFAVSLACALAMGFAIQRGATCTVIAVAEVVNRRRFMRLTSMIEASVWVLGGLLVARELHVLHVMPAGYAVSAWTILGGVLLGFGAYVNGACVFGAVARLGSGEWSFLATPVGFFAGCVALGHFQLSPQEKLAYGSPVLSASGWLAIAFIALLVIRVLFGLPRRSTSPKTRRQHGRLRGVAVARVWSPHVATIVIGVSFLFMLLLVGAWSYTEALADVARGMANNAGARTLLFLGLLGGAMLGGWTAGRLRHTRATPAQVIRCFVGGALMAWGTLLIPGGNDGLILVGMPLLWPYAWVAFATMCVSIGAAQVIEKTIAAQSNHRTTSATPSLATPLDE